MAELTFIILYLVCATWEVFMMCINKRFYGDAQLANYNITNIQVIIYFVIYLLIWLIAYRVYTRRLFRSKKEFQVKIIVDEKKIKNILLVWLIFSIAFTGLTGVGIVGGGATSKYSPIFSMLDASVFFPFYYILFRNGKYKRFFWINTILFCILQVMQGWSGFILTLFMYEFYFWAKRRHKKKNIIVCIVFTVACLVAGAFAYSIMQPFKMSVRFHYTFNRSMILDFDEAMTMLIQRISPFSRSTYALYNMPSIKEWYWFEPRGLKEIMSYVKPIMPRFLMPNKNIMSISECIFAAVLNMPFPGVSSGSGFFVYAILLFYCDWLSGIVWLFLFFIYIYVMKKIYLAFEIYKGQMDILFFGLILRILMGGSLETLFFHKEFKLIFIIPILYCLKAVKFSKNKKLNYVTWKFNIKKFRGGLI